MKRFQIYVFFKWLNLLFERKDSEVLPLRGYYLQRISEEHKLISAKKQNKKKKQKQPSAVRMHATPCCCYHYIDSQMSHSNRACWIKTSPNVFA